VGFSEKNGSGPGLINAGCYVFGTDRLDRFPINKNFSIENDFLSQEVGRIPMNLYVSKGFFIDIGIPEDFQRAQWELEPKLIGK
jgi:D-glycero-alpha-D-manno-heptose 1-phosphate guanylyltransferase